MRRLRAAACAAIAAVALVCTPAAAWALPLEQDGANHSAASAGAAASEVTVATVDASLTRPTEGDLAADLPGGNDGQALQIATAAQELRPDVLVITGIDVDSEGEVLSSLRDEYFGSARSSAGAMNYNYSFAVSTNVGQPSGTDLDGDGTVGGPADAYGFGDFPGQSSMLVLSTLPIDAANVRTFDQVLWKDLPGNRMKEAGLGSVAAQSIPLESTSLWDIPLAVGSQTVHVLATATAGGDAKADRLRRADQLAFLTAYAAGDPKLAGISDDQGRQGALSAGSTVIVAGSLGSDATVRGSGALFGGKTLKDPKQSLAPLKSEGGSWWGSALSEFLLDTSSDTRLGADDAGTRSDFVAPSAHLSVTASGLQEATDDAGERHRLVWLTARP